jgi:DegV family protein with EDD domain
MIRLVTDTGASLPPDIARKFGIDMAAIHIIFGDEVLLEGFELAGAEGYRRMAAAKELPKTNPPSPGEFVDIYNKILAIDPNTTILSIHLSGGLSETVSSARLAAQTLPDADIHIFDTRSVAMGEGLMVMEVARMIRDGKGITEIMSTLEMLRDRMQVVFAVKTLENLAKGGRIGRASYLMASMFEIKPLLKLTEGVIDAHSRHRTWQRALSELRTLVVDDVVAAFSRGGAQRLLVAVVHAHNEAEGREIADDLNEALKPDLHLFGEVGLGLGVHAGPDSLGVCWAVMPGNGAR